MVCTVTKMTRYKRSVSQNAVVSNVLRSTHLTIRVLHGDYWKENASDGRIGKQHYLDLATRQRG